MISDDTDAPIRAFIEEVARACDAEGQSYGLRELLFCIRDIPYGRPTLPRDPLSVLADWMGTCSGKHLLAARVLDIMSVESRLFCQLYRLDDAQDALPRLVTQRYMGHNIWDVHNYLEIDAAFGRIKIDVTWPQVLTSVGFPTTLEWDGTTDFRIAAPLGEVIQVSDLTLLNDLKESLLARVNTVSARAMREQYILELANFASRYSAALIRSEGIALTLRAIRSRQISPGATA